MRARDKYNERVEAVLGRSRYGEASIAVGAVATALLLAAMPLPLEAQGAAFAWTLFVALRALRRLRPGTRLRVDREGTIEVDGVEGCVRVGSFVAPWLTVVRWRPRHAWIDRTVLVVADVRPGEERRRLRVLLSVGDATGRTGRVPRRS
jgi:toxin CptA